MKRTPVDWIAALVFVFLAVFAFAEFMLEGEQRHRAEVAEARADSLAMAKRDTIYVEPLSPDGQFLMVPLDSIAYIGKVSVAVRWPKHRGVCDSLAHLADSLRDRPDYWWVKAHERSDEREIPVGVAIPVDPFASVGTFAGDSGFFHMKDGALCGYKRLSRNVYRVTVHRP